MEVFIKRFLALLLVASMPSMAVIFPPDLRYLTAYTTDNCTGASNNTFYDNVPDLAAYSLANAIKCICATGWWLTYSDTNYFSYVTARAGFDQCYNYTSSWEIKSLRYIGSPSGLNDAYYNLYQNVTWQGIELNGNTNVESVGELDRDVSYVAITGPSPWTFFTGLEHTGASVCVYPDLIATAEDGTVLNIGYHSMTELGLPDNSIRSVTLGCHSARVAKPGPSQDSSQADEGGQIIRMKH